MHYTFKQLRYFDAALRHGSIAAAAEDMNISQSSITAAIDLMEATIDTPLFRRIPAKGITPTETGREVGQRVAAFLEQCRLFDSELRSLLGTPVGTLRLACYAPAAPYVLPPLLKRLAGLYPEIRIELKEGDLQSISDLLQSGAVDMALTYRREARAGQPFLPLFRARPYALVPETWPLAGRAALSLADLAEAPMIMLDLAGAQVYFRGLFSAQGRTPNVVHTTKSSSVLRGMVGANLGYSILNIFGHADRDPAAGYVAKPLLGDLDEPKFGVAYAAEVERTAAFRAVADISRGLIESGAFGRLVLRPGAGS